MNTSPREGKSIGSNDIYYMNFNPKGNKCIWKTQIYFLNCRWYFMYMIITDLFDIDIHIFTVIKFLFNLVVKFKYIMKWTSLLYTYYILYTYFNHIKISFNLWVRSIFYNIFLIPKVINVYEKRRIILLFVDDTLCTW